jgi:hypothetical protein
MFGPVALAIPLGSALVHLGALVPMLIAAAVAFAAAIFGARNQHVPPPAPTCRAPASISNGSSSSSRAEIYWPIIFRYAVTSSTEDVTQPM